MRFLLRFGLYWLLSFTVFRIIFLLVNADRAFAMPISRWLGVFSNGLRMDLSVAAYLLVVPVLLTMLFNLSNKIPSKFIIGAYAFVLVLLATATASMDALIYGHWGFRLDLTPIMYLAHPGETFSYIAYWQMALGFGLWILMVTAFWTFYKKMVHRHFPIQTKEKEKRPPLFTLLSTLTLAALIVPMRGGLQQIPLNLSHVYFSKDLFANHAAVNTFWNLGYSYKKQRNVGARYHFYDDAYARQIVDSLYHLGANSNLTEAKLLKDSLQPINVIFVLLEGFTSNLVGCVGGEAGLTPNLDALAKEGVLFTHYYASGDRTEKGILACLGGYPNLPVASIAAYPSKTQGLPGVIQTLGKLGWQTSYYYGGEASFGNVQAYLQAQNVGDIIDKEDFDAEMSTTKWGVHDHLLYERALKDLQGQQEPFCKILMTLSSHEPFDVPMETVVPGTDDPNLFRNSVVYADRALGDFVRACKKMPWWDHTVLVMVADHGHPLPNRLSNFDPKKFEIPMVWCGGALAVQDTVINTVASQTDLPPTLLNQMGIPMGPAEAGAYPFSRFILSPSAPHFAFYAFNDGFGFVTEKGKIAFDNPSRKIIHAEGDTLGLERLGKAYLQVLAGDFTKR